MSINVNQFSDNVGVSSTKVWLDEALGEALEQELVQHLEMMIQYLHENIPECWECNTTRKPGWM